MKDDDIIAKARKRFDIAVEAESENRDKASDAMNFFMGDQWPRYALDIRKEGGQPCLVINKCKPFVRQVTNDARQMRPSIKVGAVDSQSDPETAEMLSGLIRAIASASHADSAYDWAVQNAVICGEGYWMIDEIYADDFGFDRHLTIDRIRDQMSVHLDPDAEQQDGSDAKWGFLERTMSREDFEAKYPKADVVEWKGGEGYGDWFGQDYVRVARYWEIEEKKIKITLMSDGAVIEGPVEDAPVEAVMLGASQPVESRDAYRKKVIHRIISGKEILEQTEWEGKYIPIVRVLGEEAIVDGKPVYAGMVGDMMDPQRMYNYMRSAGVERIALSPKMPYIGPRGSFKDPKWGSINKKAYAFVEYDPVMGQEPPRREAPPDVSPGLVHELEVASQDMRDVTGIYQAAMGERSNEVAGVAIDARKVESEVANFHYLDNLSKAILYTGKILIDRIPYVYRTERVLEILGENGKTEKVPVNSPQNYLDEKQREKRSPQLAVGRYDVTVSTGPSYTTQREAAAGSMLEFARAFPPAVQVMGDLIARNMDWPQADEIAKRMEAMLPPQVLAQDNPQIAAIQAQHQQEKSQLEEVLKVAEHEIAKMQLDLRNQQMDYAIKETEIKRKYLEMDQKHNEGMTKLEIEARKNLGPNGVAYD